jgi:hypothetical protein
MATTATGRTPAESPPKQLPRSAKKGEIVNSYLRPGIFFGAFVLLYVPVAHAEQDEHPADATDTALNHSPDSLNRIDIGLGLRFMPTGWFDMPDVSQRSFKAYPALGFAPFVDFRLSRYFSVGISPEVTLNVIPNRSDYAVGHMVTFDTRVQARYPSKGRIEPYAIMTGGYSAIWRNGAASAFGPAVGAALGLRLKFVRHAVFAELAYQRGFQRVDGHAYGPSYLITSLGWQIGF